MLLADESLLLGCTFDLYPNWHLPLSETPDGSYAMVRSNLDCVEAVSDAAGSRTLWTYFDNGMFVCSTSQRAIIMFLGTFEFQDAVVPWMLSTGSLGPELAWDRRLFRIPPNSTLCVDRHRWTTSIRRSEITFQEADRSPAEHMTALAEAVTGTFDRPWSSHPSSFTIPLSGGYDSRVVLSLIQRTVADPSSLNTVTWGLEENRNVAGNDAAVARNVAHALGVPNRFLPLDDVKLAPQTVLERFLECSEGRIDHLSGYIDGMALWQQMHDQGITTIVRGDEGFGWIETFTERMVRYSVGMTLATDYSNLHTLLSKFSIEGNSIPVEFNRRSPETIDSWRDRLYHAYRIPTVLSSLSDPKLSYVELVNPLISRAILTEIRKLPDRLRTGKMLFKKIASNFVPDIPYATSNAIGSPANFLSQQVCVSFISSYLTDMDGSTSTLPNGLLKHVARGMRAATETSRPSIAEPRTRSSSKLERRMRHIARNFRPVEINPNVLALRAYLLVATQTMLRGDAQYAAKVHSAN